MIKLVSLIFLAYLLGSIPTAYIAGKIRKGIDIRKEGTGNIGATNALLVIGPAFGALVYILDLFKGILAVWLAKYAIGTDISIGLAGAAVIFGHDFSIFLNFTGGKGIATTTGVILAINPQMTLYIVISWFIFLILTNYFIAASLLSCLLVPFLMYFMGLSGTYIIFGVVYLLIALYTHEQGFVRIIWGKEKKALDSLIKYFKREKLV